MPSRKGSPNRKTADIWELLNKHGFNPIERMILFAKGDAVALGYDSDTYVRESKDGTESTTLAWTIPPDLSAMMTKELCKYIYPQRKAIEIDSQVTINNPFSKMTLEEKLEKAKEVTELLLIQGQKK